MLTVAKETSLALNVSMSSNFNFTVSGRLLSEGSPVGNRPVGIYANGTLKANVTTVDYYGNFSVSLNLPAINYEQTVYNVQAEFDGDSPCNAVAYSTTPNGTQYAVCTTTQYGYKPSSNSTVLTVTPESTQTMTPTKTPGQLQQDAKDSGWLSVYGEWSWWYPWYRLHVVINMNGAKIDVGFSPILPDIATSQFCFPSNFVPPIPINIDQEQGWQIIQNVLIGTSSGIFAAMGTAVALANTHVPGAACCWTCHIRRRIGYRC